MVSLSVAGALKLSSDSPRSWEQTSLAQLSVVPLGIVTPSMEAVVLFGHCTQPSYTLLVHWSDLCGPGAETLPPV